MTKPKLDIKVKRVPGDSAWITLKLEWNAKTMPAERQKQVWEGIGTALAALLTRAEAKEFLAKLAIAAKEAPADARA